MRSVPCLMQDGDTRVSVAMMQEAYSATLPDLVQRLSAPLRSQEQAVGSQWRGSRCHRDPDDRGGEPAGVVFVMSTLAETDSGTSGEVRTVLSDEWASAPTGRTAL
jgi:hypothetical protein